MTLPLSNVRPELADLVAAVRGAVGVHAGWQPTARLVAERLRGCLPGPEVLTPQQRLGDPDGYQDHTLYVEPDGSFSIVGLVFAPGQVTRIHDHLTWCVFGVVQGIEHEELFDANLTPIGENDNHPGEVSGFAPPGDIHRVRNACSDVTISMHVYGTDISRVGSSVRRYYD